jgi:hypothetical protein
MESTAAYWIPLFQILEERGFKVYLVNAHYLKGKNHFRHLPRRAWLEKGFYPVLLIRVAISCFIRNGWLREQTNSLEKAAPARDEISLAHTDEGYRLASESTSPSFIFVGRLRGDPHWPLLGDL